MKLNIFILNNELVNSMIFRGGKKIVVVILITTIRSWIAPRSIGLTRCRGSTPDSLVTIITAEVHG